MSKVAFLIAVFHRLFICLASAYTQLITILSSVLSHLILHKCCQHTRQPNFLTIEIVDIISPTIRTGIIMRRQWRVTHLLAATVFPLVSTAGNSRYVQIPAESTPIGPPEHMPITGALMHVVVASLTVMSE